MSTSETPQKTNSSPKTPRRVLAIDTATRTQSLALVDGDTVLDHSQQRVKFNHGSSLLERIDRILQAQQVEVSDLDLIAVGRGPGSFTGLRVGLSIAKSLSRAKHIPLAGVSTLAALAYPSATTQPKAAVCAALDARRSEVYTGLYALKAPGAPALSTLEADQTATTQDLRDRLIDAASSRPIILIGDAFQKYADLQNWPTAQITTQPAWAALPPATAIAQLGRLAAAQGNLDDVHTLEPNYIRPTEAEIKFGG